MLHIFKECKSYVGFICYCCVCWYCDNMLYNLFFCLCVARYTERTVLQSYDMSGLVVQFHQIEQQLYKMSTCQCVSSMTGR